MPFGLSSELLVVAAVIFVMGTMVCMQVFSLPTALVTAAIKTIIPLVYFAYFYEVPTSLDFEIRRERLVSFSRRAKARFSREHSSSSSAISDEDEEDPPRKKAESETTPLLRTLSEF